MAAGGGIELGILGPLAAWRDGVELPLGGSKQRAVLALLALERGRTVSTDALIEALWPEQPPGRPHTAIQGYVSHLRKVLGPESISTDANGYRLDLGADALDAAEFEHRLAGASGPDPRRRASELAAALALWRGSALAEFTYDSWAQAEIGRLAELRLAAIEARVDADLECGRTAELVGELEGLVQEHPTRERLRRQLMLALYRAGRQADALDAYAAARTALVEELGIDPGPELQDLQRAILKQDESLAAPALVAAPTVRLPMSPTPFLGREPERARLLRLLGGDGERLVTITGPGGMGKTRLAIRAAADLADFFAGGVWFVELASLREPEHVVPAIAATLDASGDLAVRIGDQRLLLVLDNFEQVLGAALPVSGLLDACPGVSLLVTSRERLHLADEVEVSLPPLEPSDAADLFAERAGRLGVELDPDAGEIGELCARLDGLPLAIELAAARTKLFAPADLLARLGDRLDLLGAGPQDVPARHRTLPATIEWSYELLAESERDLFEGLAVFAGSFDIADVEAVVPCELETLGALVDKNLVVRRSDGPGRFGLLATVRAFAFDRLQARADKDQIHRRHAERTLAVVADADDRSDGPEHVAAFSEIARRQDDIRGALDWAEAAGEDDLLLGLGSATGWFWYVRGHFSEGKTRLATALASGCEDTHLRARACMRAGLIADALLELDSAQALFEEALAIRRRQGDRRGEHGALGNIGNLALQSGDYANARRAHEQALSIAREIGDQACVASSLHNIALVDLVEDDPESAARLLEETVVLTRSLGNEHLLALAYGNLGAALVDLGEIQRGARLLADSVRILRELDVLDVMAPTLEDLGALAVASGDALGAARRLGAAAAVRVALGTPIGSSDADRAARTERRSRGELGDELFDRAWAEGRALSLEQALEFAERGTLVGV